MNKSVKQPVNEYLETVDSPQKEELQRINNIITQLAPDAEQVITYGMPGYKLDGKYLIAFAAFTNHMSIFPGAEVIEKLNNELSGFTTSKGTIQFTQKNPLTSSLIKKVIRQRVAAIRSA